MNGILINQGQLILTAVSGNQKALKLNLSILTQKYFGDL